VALKDLVTQEQRKTKFYNIMKIYYYLGGWGFLLLGIATLIFLIGYIFYYRVWLYNELIVYALIFSFIPVIGLSGGIYSIKRIKRGLREAEWDHILKVESETDDPPWAKRRR